LLAFAISFERGEVGQLQTGLPMPVGGVAQLAAATVMPTDQRPVLHPVRLFADTEW